MVPSLSQSRGWGPLQISIFSEGQEKQKNPAEFLSRILCNWLVDNVVDMLLTHIGVDSTTSNTGWKKGNIACPEKLTGKFVCCIPMSWDSGNWLRNMVARHVYSKTWSWSDQTVGWCWQRPLQGPESVASLGLLFRVTGWPRLQPSLRCSRRIMVWWGVCCRGFWPQSPTFSLFTAQCGLR